MASMKEKGEVNLTGVKQSKGVWLVKVPKYLAQQWDKATEKGEVGKITIEKKQGKTQAPRDHPFTMNSLGGQTMAVFSQGDKEICLEGTVVHRAECRPVVTDNYMKLKKVQMKESLKPQRLSQQLERAITTVFKPVANHNFNVEYEKKKKSEGKMVRAERQVVLDMLFTAFEKHQYYNIKDLVDITKQPVTYLKEIMREIGTYNSKGVHKSTWELKAEYRHYQSPEEEDDEMQTA
ncbi:general transcription factor IIF subunit 2-like isoform X4 [Syngnathoides biaculeatus]|uniref:general transcription factor IIF subunit 2-like isoform X4 n=1 Tax=Syngnathoides biaculeatus TaxID=300417 RepID=UPI002ADDBF54|nr:general transcription factor IIF subunit 2-like isoform X4 [Syngnathoides biaculeatus]